jgi:Phage portal protein
VPGALDRVNAQFAALGKRPQNLSLDEYASWFGYGGTEYPLLQTTYGQVDQERIAWTADWAARTSGPVSSLIYARLRVFSQVRFQWARFSGAQPGDLFGTADLKILEQPWPGGTTSDLLARMEWDASAAGNAYTRRRGSSLFRLRPAWVIIVLGSQENTPEPWLAADTTVAGYLWVPPGGQPKFFQPSQVAHYAPLPNPDAHFLGESWISPVLRDLQADQMAVEHKYKFFENGATPNLAIRFDPSVTIDAVRDFKELLEDEHRGVANAFKTLYLGGGADPVTVGLSFKDMDYAVVQGRAESRLASAAGVHPTIAGFSEGLQGSSLNAGNYDAARRLFAESTMSHLWGNAASSLQPLLTTPPGAALWYDSRIPFMRQDEGDRADVQQKEAQTITALIRDGYKPDSVVAAVKNNDWSLLAHSGMVSVQLWEPGAESPRKPEPGAESVSQPTGAPAPPSQNGKVPAANGARR